MLPTVLYVKAETYKNQSGKRNVENIFSAASSEHLAMASLDCKEAGPRNPPESLGRHLLAEASEA
jgi:hypothetical protein